MYKIRLSPYHKIFYNEWKINPNGSNYNIVFDQILANNLNVAQLKYALSRLINEYIIFNSHINVIADEVYWVQNAMVRELEEFVIKNNEDDNVLNYARKPFAVENEPLCPVPV